MVATCTTVDRFTLTDFEYDDDVTAHTSVCQHVFDGSVTNFVDSIYGNLGRNGIPLSVRTTCDFGGAAAGGALTVQAATRTTVGAQFHNITTCSGDYTGGGKTTSCDCSTVGCSSVGQVSLECGDLMMPCFNLFDISDVFDELV